MIALVRWRDAYSDLGKTVYSKADIDHTPLIMESVGHVLRHDEAGITIAMDYITESDWSYRNVGFIPAEMLIDVIPLKQAKRTRKGGG